MSTAKVRVTSVPAPAYLPGNERPLEMDTVGNLFVNIASGTLTGGGNAAAGSTGTAPPASASYTGFNSGGTLVGVSSSNPLPITGTLTGGGNAAASPTGSAVPASGDYLAFSVGGTLTGVSAAAPLPVSAASLPLPTGAATSANQPTNAAQGSTTSGQTGGLMQGAVTTAAPTYTTGQTDPLSLTTGGALRTADANLGTAQGAAIAGLLGPMVQGEVIATGTNPSFTVSQVEPLILTPSGSLRTTLYAPGSANQAIATNSAGAAGGAHVAIGVVYTAGGTTLTSGQEASASGNTQGALYVDTEGLKASYSISGTVALAATPTDFLFFPGSATKTVHMRRIRIYSSASTAGQMTLSVVKRSSANAGGTSTSATVVPHDANNAAGTAVPLVYTANPSTLGTPVGSVDTALVNFGVSASGPVYDEVFGQEGCQAIVLRGTGQSLCLNLNAGAVPTGATLSYRIAYTEE